MAIRFFGSKSNTFFCNTKSFFWRGATIFQQRYLGLKYTERLGESFKALILSFHRSLQDHKNSMEGDKKITFFGGKLTFFHRQYLGLKCTETLKQSFKALIFSYHWTLQQRKNSIEGEQKKTFLSEATVFHWQYLGLKCTERLGESFKAFILEKYYSPLFWKFRNLFFPPQKSSTVLEWTIVV